MQDFIFGLPYGRISSIDVFYNVLNAGCTS